MNAIQQCPKCGAALTSDAFEGLCPECMVQVMRAVPTLVLVTERPGDKIGRYKLLQKIGEGGCGIVYMAEQEEPVRRRVALKVIKLGMDTAQVIARFEAERQALALMDHPNIAKVFDAGATDTGRPYFVMELVRGIKITDYCDQNQLSAVERLNLFIQVCQATQHAHQKGIIHRDIKPSNVLVTQHDGVPVPKVIDFGIAKATTDQRLTDKTVFTAFEQFIGTPAYMSPEQAEMSGLDIDTRSDIYSLGVLLYELLTGSTPFDARELMASGLDAMRKTIREKEPVRPSTKLSQTLVAADMSPLTSSRQKPTPEEEVRASPRQLLRLKETIALLRGDLDWIVMKCLEKDRTRRYETANGLAADLKRHLANEPVVARPPSTAYRFHKAWQRNKAAFTSAILIGMIVKVALVFSIWSYMNERQARENEFRQRQAAEQQRRIAVASGREASEQRQTAEQNQVLAEENARQARLNLYAADMSLAQIAVQANNFGRAARLLERHRPKQGEEDLRHWEWRYLWKRIQGEEIYSLPEFDHHVFNLDHSPNGYHLAVALFNGRILIWDLQRNRLLKELFSESRRGEIQAIAKCLYTADGSTLIAHHGGIIRRWDARTFEERPPLRTPGALESVAIRHIAVSRDGRHVAAYAGWRDVKAADFQPQVILWDARTGEVLWTRPGSRFTAHHGTVCFNTAGSKLFVGETTGRVRRLDVPGGALDRDWLAHEGFGITALAISPDGSLLASGAGYTTGDIKLWDPDTGRLIETLSGHTRWVSWLEFSADGRLLASASSDQTARIWDLEARPRATRSVLRGHQDELYALSLNADASQLATGSKDGIVSFWSTQAKEEAGQYVSRPIPIERYYSSPDGTRLFIPNEQGQIVELDPLTLSERGVVREFGTNVFLTFLPGSDLVLATRSDVGTKAFDLKTRHLVREMDGIVEPRYAVKEKRLYTLRLDPPERVVWDVGRWEIVATLPAASGIDRPVFSPDSRLVAWEPRHGVVSIAAADPGGGFVPVTQFKAHKRFLTGLAFSPDGKQLATTSQTGFGFLWSTEDWNQMATLRGHSRAIHGVGFSPDSGRVFTTGSMEDAIKLWDISSYQEVLTLPAEGSLFHNPALLEDNRTLLATSWDNGNPKLHIWRAPTWEEIEATEAEKKRRNQSH